MILPLVDPKVLGGVLDVLAHVYGGSVTRMAAADGVSPAVASADLLSSLGEVQRRAEHAAAGMLLDRLPFALLVVDADGRLLYANASGSALLAAGDRVRLDGDGVHAVRPEEDGVLHSAVAALAVPQPPVRTTESCQLTSAREGRRFGVLAMRAVTEPPAIVLLLADPAREQALRSLLRSLFGMTRSEAELCLLLLQGLTLDDAARHRHVAPASARAAWQAIAWKTGGTPPGLLFQVLQAALTLPLDLSGSGADH